MRSNSPILKRHLKGFTELSSTCTNALANAKIVTVADLLMHSRDDLACLQGFGRKSLDQVMYLIEKYNLKMSGGRL